MKPQKSRSLDQALVVADDDGWSCKIFSSFIDQYMVAGKGDSNVPLSQSRAQAVSSYLDSQGVSSSQFKNVAGYGSQNPIVDKTVAPQNRRVEVYLYASPEMVQKAENGTLK